MVTDSRTARAVGENRFGGFGRVRCRLGACNRRKNMVDYWAVTCKTPTCKAEIGLETYDDPGPKNVVWHKSERFKCQACGKEYDYSGDDFHVSKGPDPI